MDQFTLALAGKRVGVICEFDETRGFCEGYLTDEPADFTVSVSRQDLRQEWHKVCDEAKQAGTGTPIITADWLAMTVICRKTALRMLDFDTLLFHGSAISVDGQGYLFTALSGTGKSTHTGLWREYFGDRAKMINDDKPFLRITEDQVYVCGNPWNGKHGLGTNEEVPLKGLCILTRGEENVIEPITAAEAFPLLLQQGYRPDDPMAMGKVLDLLTKLSNCTGLYRLGCNMNPEAALVAYNGMNRKEHE